MCVPEKREQLAQVAHGMFVQYDLENWRDMFVINHVEPLALPVGWVSEDILFLHRVLEVCASYVPYGHEPETFFRLFSPLYTALKAPVNASLFKTIFLCKMLFILGLYPCEEAYDARLFNLISRSDTSVLDIHMNAECEGKLTQWLADTLASLNNNARLKTFSFAKHSDVIL